MHRHPAGPLRAARLFKLALLACAALTLIVGIASAQARSGKHKTTHHTKAKKKAHARHTRSKEAARRARDWTAPTAPHLDASAGNQIVHLGWSASSDAVGVKGYRVYRNAVLVTTVPATTRTFDDAPLANGVPNAYFVKAYDRAGNLSPTSNQVTATPTAGTTDPGVPTDPGPGPGPGTPGPAVPNGPGGTWTLKFDDEFDGTSLDTTKWTNTWFNGGTMNNVATVASNVSVGGGVASLQLSDATHGALIHTTEAAGRYSLPVGGVVEARVLFPGSTTQDIYNWPAFWTGGTDAWPAGGEHDIAEGLGGDLTINYHGATNTQNYGTPAGAPWGSAYHTFTLYRKAGSADVYWDGVLKKSYPTGDSGESEDIILNAGASGSRSVVTGSAGAIKVDYVRAWAAG
jgi:hypothetical protein